MNSTDHRHSNQSRDTSNGHSKSEESQQNDAEIDSELLELETALNDIEKAMDKIESQNSNIQTKLRDLLESNRQMAKEFSDIRRGMSNKFKDVTQQLEQAPGIAQDLAAVTSETLSTIEQEMSSNTETNKFK